MSIRKLVKLTLIGHDCDKSAVLEELQELGCLHLIPLTPEGEALGEEGSSREAREALRFLASCPQRRRQVADASRFDAAGVERQALGLQQRFHELRHERDALAERIENLRPWGEFELPPREALAGQRFWFYLVPHHRLAAVAGGELRWQVVKRDNRFCYVVVLSEDEPEQMPVPRVRTGAVPRGELERRLDDVLLEIEDVEAERASLTRWCALLARALDGLEDRAARQRAASQTARVEPVYALQAWLPVDRQAEVEAYAERRGLALALAAPEPGESPPTLFRNPPTLRGGEDLVRFYMTPSYWLWDPSRVVFFSFAVFFAMILADVGYALVLALIVAVLWRRLGRSEAGARWRTLLASLAAATVVYGVMVGSYFGVEPSGSSILGRLAILDLRNFDTMMAVSILIGVSHLVYANLRDAARFATWPERLPSLGWALVLLGGLLFWGGAQLAAPELERGGLTCLAAGLLLVVVFTGHGEPLLQRIWLGILALPGLSSAFGDVLSYLRLFALGLASASLAVAFNDMASNIRSAVPGVGLFLALLVLLLGHAMNFALSVSSGFIHGLRLNVIEFFKWGVKEEGTPYSPFECKENTDWTISS